MCICGDYKINNGSLSGLTNLQKLAILIICNERMKFAENNKLIGAIAL